MKHHLGRVEMLTPNLARSLWYFRDLLGMEVVHRSGRSVFLRGYGDCVASSVKLTEASNAGVGCVSWRAVSRQALQRRVRTLETSDLGLGWTNGDFGLGPSFSFMDPEGHIMEVYYEESAFRRPESAPLHALEFAAEIHRPWRRGPAHRPSGAADMVGSHGWLPF